MHLVVESTVQGLCEVTIVGYPQSNVNSKRCMGRGNSAQFESRCISDFRDVTVTDPGQAQAEYSARLNTSCPVDTTKPLLLKVAASIPRAPLGFKHNCA